MTRTILEADIIAATDETTFAPVTHQGGDGRVSLAPVTTTAPGLMSAADKVALDGVPGAIADAVSGIDLPASVDRTFGVLTEAGRYASKIQETRSPTIFYDRYQAASDVVINTGDEYTPAFASEFATPQYLLGGPREWIVGADGLRAGDVASDRPSVAFPGFFTPLNAVWYQSQKGIELKSRVSIPAVNCSAHLALNHTDGSVTHLQCERRLASSDLYFRVLNRSAAGADTVALIAIPNVPAGVTQDLTLTLRIYRPDMASFEVEGIQGSAGPDIEPDGVLRAHHYSYAKFYDKDITSVGVGVSGAGFAGVRIREFAVSAIPAIGSSAYNSLPPMPAPVVPPEIPPAGGSTLIWNAMTESVIQDQILNFSVINMADLATRLDITPIDNYYAYFSTDHGSGGIFLVTAPEPQGPWTAHTGPLPDGRIYDDTTAGHSSTETPVVRYDPQNNRLLMMYHCIVFDNGQRSIMAESVDGLTWTRIGIVTTVSQRMRPLNRFFEHDGYSTFFLDPLGVVPGWSSFMRQHGMQARSRWGVARSIDGEKFTPDPVPLRMPALQRVSRNNPYVIDNPGYGTQPFEYLGQRLLPISPFRTGAFVGDPASTGYLAIVALGDDMRNMSAAEHKIHASSAGDGMRPEIGSVMRVGDLLYIYTIRGNREVHLNVFDLAAPPAGETRPF